MTWILTRTKFTKDGIFGEMQDDKNNCVAFTLEHAYPDSNGTTFSPKVPEGTYTCVRGQHTLHSGPIETFEVTNVPGHSGILLHYGNVNADSDGCVLLGDEIQGIMITHSRQTFAEVMNELAGIDSFQLEVKND